MPLRIDVLCRSPACVTREELAGHVLDGVYFDDDPTFEPAPDADPDWSFLEIRWSPERRPVQLERHTRASDAAFLDAVLGELVETLVEQGAPEALRARIGETAQYFAFELGFDPPDDLWDMLDGLEAMLARRLDGVVYVSGEGLYDEDLEVLWREPGR